MIGARCPKECFRGAKDARGVSSSGIRLGDSLRGYAFQSTPSSRKRITQPRKVTLARQFRGHFVPERLLWDIGQQARKR